jgi:hypothetical protein
MVYVEFTSIAASLTWASRYRCQLWCQKRLKTWIPEVNPDDHSHIDAYLLAKMQNKQRVSLQAVLSMRARPANWQVVYSASWREGSVDVGLVLWAYLRDPSSQSFLASTTEHRDLPMMALGLIWLQNHLRKSDACRSEGS